MPADKKGGSSGRPESRIRICRQAWFVLFAPLAGGCLSAPSGPDQSHVASDLAERTGLTVESAKDIVPGTVDLSDGLSGDEAAQIALCNNALFQELLADLGLARGDLIQAGLLPNPDFLFVFPLDPKPFKYAVDLPLDALWLRPHRIHAATADLERNRHRLTQAGLDLIRDARVAHAAWALAKARVTVADENRQLRARIAGLAEARLKDGDATPLESSTATIDAMRAKQEQDRATNDVAIAEERLRNVLGLGGWRNDLVPQVEESAFELDIEIEALVAEAVANRPDVHAAEQAVAAADARIALARLGWLRIFGLADATSGPTGHNYSPGLRLGVPIFNWNQGAVERAEADRERAIRQVRTVKDRVILDVRLARAQHVQAAADYRQWTRTIRPAVEEAVTRAEKAFRGGGAPLLLVLETSRQAIETRAREVQLRADLATAWAELERAVGHTIRAESRTFAIDREPPAAGLAQPLPERP